MALNTRAYIENYLKIRTKEATLVNFKLNAPQERLYETIKRLFNEGKPVRIIILKARQMGFSTCTGGVIFKMTATEKLVQSVIITHRDSTTTELFEMYKRFYNNLPKELQPEVQASNAKELIFNTRSGTGLDSKIKCMTATDEGVGRGGTTQYIHMSEYGFWNNAPLVYASLMQCVPDTPNSIVIIESTANGYNDFKTKWDNAVAGKNDYVPLFFAWFEMETYRKPYHGFELTTEEKQMKERFGIDNEQLAWRRWKIANDFDGNVDMFHQEFPSTPEEAFLYSGNSFFDVKAIKETKDNGIKPVAIGYFTYDQNDNLKPVNIRWVENHDKNIGIIKIYKQNDDYVPYVIGGDTAGEGSDKFIGQVLNNMTGENVATLTYEGSDEVFYTQQIYCLGKKYNDALLAIETNFSTYPQKKLEEWKYPKFYVRETFDNYTNKPKASFGFRTDSISRPNILANLQSVVKNNCYLINDYETLTEMETFVKNEKGRPEAMSGAHDDHVMATAIAYHARQQQDFKLFEHIEEKKERELPFALKDEERGGDEDYLWN